MEYKIYTLDRKAISNEKKKPFLSDTGGEKRTPEAQTMS